MGADVVAEACCRIPLSRQMVGPAGLVDDPDARGQISAVLTRLTEHLERA